MPFEEHVTQAQWFTEFGKLQQQAETISVELQAIRQDMKKLTNPNYANLIAGATLMVIGIGSLWGIAIRPISDALTNMQADLMKKDLIIEKFGEHDRDLAAIHSDLATKASKEDVVVLHGALNDKAAKDDLNRVIIDIDRRLPKR